MAADRAAASGIDAGEGLRQRAVGPSQVSPAAPQPVDDKKLTKKVGHSKERPLDFMSNHDSGSYRPRHLQPVGAHLCPADFHGVGLLHPSLENWH